jgi:hypothetical protein
MSNPGSTTRLQGQGRVTPGFGCHVRKRDAAGLVGPCEEMRPRGWEGLKAFPFFLIFSLNKF